MSWYAGVDLGSAAVKVVLVDAEGRVIGRRAAPTAGQFQASAAGALDALLAELGGEPSALARLVATGYGRKLLGGATRAVSEITANAAGAAAAAQGRARTIVNVGGQDAKVIVLDERGGVADFLMNDKCAAGTGRFLEMAARSFELEPGDLGEVHLRGRLPPVTLSSTCTVFAESEIVSLAARGHTVEEIVAGIHYGIARRLVRLARKLAWRGPVLFDGGPAANAGLARAVGDELGCELLLAAAPQFTTAWGAALLARAAG